MIDCDQISKDKVLLLKNSNQKVFFQVFFYCDEKYKNSKGKKLGKSEKS